MPAVCDISTLATGRRAIGLGRFCALAILYLEGIFVLMALTQGELVFPLLGAVLIAAQVPLALKSARITLHVVWVYRLLAFSLVFVVVMGFGWSIDIAARILFALLLFFLSGMVLIAASRAASIAQTFGKVAETRVLEYCLFANLPSHRRRLQDALPPRYRKGLPWFVAAAILVVLGIVLSNITDRGLVIFFVIPAVFLVQRGRRHMAPRASEAKRADDRPPTLILRSFQDDRIAMERFSLVPKRTFEQVVATTLKTMGPPLIVGDPGEKLARLGAFREYFVNNDWQTAVARLIDEVALLVFILGDTENLLWEFRQAIGKCRTADILIIVPPLDQHILRSRWRRFAEGIAGSINNRFPSEFPDDAILGLFFLEDDPVFIVGRKRGITDFRLGIRLFLSLQSAKITSLEGLRGFVKDHLPVYIKTVGGGEHVSISNN